MFAAAVSWDNVSLKKLAFGSTALMVCWIVATWIVNLIANLIRSDSTPNVGSNFTFKDLARDVGLDNETRRELEEGYYKAGHNLHPRHFTTDRGTVLKEGQGILVE